MSVVILDAGPLSLVTHPKGRGEAAECLEWLLTIQARGFTVAVPEIADYEVRRELLRANKMRAIAKLDELKVAPDVLFLPITSAAMLEAARLWADARNNGLATADDKALDADVILAAQARLLGAHALVATNNVGHLGRYVNAKRWQEIG